MEQKSFREFFLLFSDRPVYNHPTYKELPFMPQVKSLSARPETRNPKGSSTQDVTQVDLALLRRLAKRAHYYSTQMIHLANNRDDVQKGDPKIGGHPAACASLTHIMGALHLLVREPQDHIAVKPHGSPMDHAYHHMLGLFYHQDGSRFSTDQAKRAMHHLRKFGDPDSASYDPVFQSYHAAWDPDAFNYFPSGTVGIPPVASAYMALGYRFAKDHGFEVPENAHFWSIMGDSEFREGSLHECIPDLAERHLGNVTWIVDYNRQNLDGARIKSDDLTGTDADRIEKLAKANGWDVLNLRHGHKRTEFFQKTGGEALRKVFELHLSDYEFQSLLLAKDGKIARKRFIELEPILERALSALSDQEVRELVEDLGGHDFKTLYDAFKKCRLSQRKPTMVIAHTIKGWNLDCAAASGNHSALPSDEEVVRIRDSEKIPSNDVFALFGANSEETAFCAKRGEYLHKGFESQRALKQRNLERALKRFDEVQGLPDSFGIDLKLVPWANTQWMWGQLAAKLVRIANTKEPKGSDLQWKPIADALVTMAPDVGTSTNLNPSMDGKIYGPDAPNFEDIYHVRDSRRPDLVPLERQTNRHIRFEIEEANAMSCAGSFGKLRDVLGVPVLPMMSIYDFFIKRALDQLFYNAYWRSSFILVGTPSGVSLSPEGAQHSWKSDLQIPNLITWEPAYALELDWIFADAVKRHYLANNLGRQSVLIRAVTMSIDQKPMMACLKKQNRFQGKTDAEILAVTREECLAGGYWLINHEGANGYLPGENVVHIFAMGTLVPQAIEASQNLEKKGVFANVIVVTSPDLLCGNLGHDDDFRHLKKTLGINGNLYLTSGQVAKTNDQNQSGAKPVLTPSNILDLRSIRGARIPIVSTHDGEPGLLDNLGSIIGVPHETLAVRKHSKSGRPVDVFAYQHINAASVEAAVDQVFETAASEEILVDPRLLENLKS